MPATSTTPPLYLLVWKCKLAPSPSALTLNLVREEIKSGKPLGVTPDEVEDSFMRGAEYRKP